MKKRIISVILSAVLCLGILAGCATENVPAAGSDTASVEEQSESSADMTDAVDPEGTHIVVDHFGNEVEVPNTIETIVTTSITPMPAVYCMFAGSAERLIGMSPSSKAAAENSLLADIMPEIKDVPTDFMTGGEVNIEALLAMNPDIVFCNTSKEDEYKQLVAAGLTVIGVSTSQWGSDSVETFDGWVTLLGEVFNEEDKAAGITEYGHEMYDMIQERVSGLEDSEKKRILFLYNYSDGTINTSGKNHFGQYWCEATGGINVAGENDTKSLEINMEQIYEWDPDMIYITNFVPYLAEDLYQNTAFEGHDWSVVRAVQEGKVYKCPLGVYRWYPPSSDTPLMLLWMAKTNYPDLFADIDMEQEMKAYYKKFYNIELSDEDIIKIFNPTREAAGA
ncbi:MAG: ABC transporter substrate-binding protein [Lachnospiraceae bacterium]|nr:ABC transporter substrate-binding protein [Lachnospiraceae bacterium]